MRADRAGRGRGRSDPRRARGRGPVGRRRLLADAGAWRGAAANPGSSRSSPRAGARLAHERRDRGGARGRRPAGPLQAAAGGQGRAARGDARRAARPRRALLRPLAGAGRVALARRHRRALRGRGRRVRARRPVRRGRPPRRRHALADRPRAAALLEPRALQGDPRRPGARRLQRARDRAAGRAEDRRLADEPQPAALERGARALDAAARDPGRRREVQARLDHRPARPGGALLPALARHRRGRGARPADLGLRRRGAAEGPGPAVRGAVEKRLQARLAGVAGLVEAAS